MSRLTTTRLGFTLAETLLAVVVLASISALLTSTFAAVRRQARIDTRAAELSALAREAHALAVIDGQAAWNMQVWRAAAGDTADAAGQPGTSGRPLAVADDPHDAASAGGVHVLVCGRHAGVGAAVPSVDDTSLLLVAGLDGTVDVRTASRPSGSAPSGSQALRAAGVDPAGCPGR